MSYTGSVVYLKNVPQGAPAETDFEIRTREIAKDSVEEGAIVIKILYLSVDPYLVGKLRGASTYTDSFKVGQPLSSGAYGQVVESKSPDFKVGDNVTGMFEWAEYVKITPTGGVRKAIEGVDAEALLSVCGITGITAYFGLLDIAKPKEGDTVLVSGAAGATGSIVGQIAKIKGCNVVGIAGSDDKCDLLVKEFGFDKAINYKKVANIKDAIAEACPKGVDVYFDNVGGETLDAALRCMNNHGRVTLCGAISQYTVTTPQQGPRNETVILQKRLKVQGILIPDYIPQFATAYKELIPWYLSGKLKKRVTIYDTIQQAVPAFLDMLKGANTGKMLVKF